MLKSSRKFQVAALALLAPCVVSIAVAAPAYPGSHDWKWGVGAFAAANNTNYRTVSSNDYTVQIQGGSHTTVIQDYANTVLQSGFAGGIQLDRGHYFGEKRQYFGFQFGAQLNSGSAQQRHTAMLEDSDSGLTYPEQLNDTYELEYQLDLPLVYGFTVGGDDNLMYFKGGVSYASLKETAKSSMNYFSNSNSNTFRSDELNSVNNHKSLVGAILGVGFQRAVTHQLDIFAEFNYYYYGGYKFDELSQNFRLAGGSDDLVSSGQVDRSAKVSASNIRIGVNLNL